MKLSFIIPIYNVEEYLEECFYSIFSQMNNDCEIILVDDGSLDSSSQMCDKYAYLHDNIQVIHKKNGGLASARNAGLEVATGDYISFIDSDDRISPSSVQAILSWIDEGGADLCFMKGIKFYPSGVQEDFHDSISRDGIQGKNKDEILKYLATRPKFPGSSCTKIYRSNFLKDNNLHFPYINRQSEDLGFVRDCIIYANQYDALDIPFYEYRRDRDGSITNTASYRSVLGLITFISETIDNYSESQKPINPYGKYALCFAAYEFGVLLFNYANSDKEVKSLYKDRIEKIKWVVKYSSTKRQAMIKMLVNLFGLEKSSRMISAVYRTKNSIKTSVVKK